MILGMHGKRKQVVARGEWQPVNGQGQMAVTVDDARLIFGDLRVAAVHQPALAVRDREPENRAFHLLARPVRDLGPQALPGFKPVRDPPIVIGNGNLRQGYLPGPPLSPQPLGRIRS